MEIVKEEAGYCPTCEQQTIFRSYYEWYCDHYKCERCGSIPRQRALHNVLSIYFPNWKFSKIHESSPCNDYIMKQAPLYSFSHYFPDHKLGETVNGIRNENIEKLTFPDETFDLFITQDVLEHVFNPAMAIKEMFRVLRSGGALVFTVPIQKSER